MSEIKPRCRQCDKEIRNKAIPDGDGYFCTSRCQKAATRPVKKMAKPRRHPQSKARWDKVPVNVPMTSSQMAKLAGVSKTLLNYKLTNSGHGHYTPLPFPVRVEKYPSGNILTRLPRRDAPDPEPIEGELDWTK